MAIDFLVIKDQTIRDNCDDLLDDRHTESVTFVRDDVGAWYARSNVRGVGFTETRWWRVRGDVPDELDGVIESARSLARL